jgi:hypothetical protein
MAHSLDHALGLCRPEERIFVMGGIDTFESFQDVADSITFLMLDDTIVDDPQTAGAGTVRQFPRWGEFYLPGVTDRWIRRSDGRILHIEFVRGDRRSKYDSYSKVNLVKTATTTTTVRKSKVGYRGSASTTAINSKEEENNKFERELKVALEISWREMEVITQEELQLACYRSNYEDMLTQKTRLESLGYNASQEELLDYCEDDLWYSSDDESDGDV